VLVTHSPPKGHCDADAGGHSLGSTAILDCIQRTSPRLVVCGHVHPSWGARSRVGSTTVINAGPEGVEVDLEAL
jgi:Icc-related predicted phosphoesterase